MRTLESYRASYARWSEKRCSSPTRPWLARCEGPLEAGVAATVRLVEADPATGRIGFAATTP